MIMKKMGKTPPKRYHTRIANLIADMVDCIDLDLNGLRVLTEAATGPYVVTPVIAALAGAEVIALAKGSRHGTVARVRDETVALAEEMDVQGRINIVEDLTDNQIAAADIVTNSGHLRPLNAEFVGRMKRGAVITLMYENWEFREEDVDLQACRDHGVIVAGTNEQHPNVGVFNYLGMAALYGLFHCQVPPPFSRILLICDNSFLPYIAKTLLACGAELEILTNQELSSELAVRCRSVEARSDYDAVIAADPGPQPVIGHGNNAKYNVEQIGNFAALVQVFGDVDRTCLHDVVCFPASEPAKGHMGINLCELGPDPVVHLQAGGLKVGQILNMTTEIAEELMEYCQVVTL